jgi:hypothetical protein
MINFIIGNHETSLVGEATLEYLVEGLGGVGAPISYAIDEYRGEGVNLVLEGATIPAARALSGFRKKYPQSRMFLVVIDAFVPDGMRGPQGDGAAAAKERSAAFRDLAAAADGLVFLAESPGADYRKLHPRTHYLPLVALPGYPALTREPEALRDIDVYFSGTLTDYRRGVFERLRQAGLEVTAQPAQFPDYVRRHFLSRARLAVGLRPGPDGASLSKHRAHYYLLNRVPHLFEATPDRTDLHPHVQFAAPGEAFVEQCVDLVRGRRAFPERVFDDFRRDPHLDPAAAFGALRHFLTH